jgi:single-strand DNA-binding protein
MYQKTIIVGNVGRDAEMRMTPQGKAVTQFSVAVSLGYGENKKTQWFDVTCWERLAETCNQYVKKGDKVLCDGTIELNQYTAQDGTPKASLRLTARDVKFLTPRNDSGGAAPFVDEETPF